MKERTSNSFSGNSIDSGFVPRESTKKITITIIILATLWVLMRLPNLNGPFTLKMDAASAGVAWFIHESWIENPESRWWAPVDHRSQWDELETGKLYPYLHVPPLAIAPVGIWIKFFGLSEVSLRSAGIAFSLLAMILGFLCVLKISGYGLALFAIGFMMLSPQSLHYSRSVDPMVTNVFWLAAMWLSYLRYAKDSKYFWAWLVISALGMLSYWCAFGVFASIGIYHIYSRGFQQIPKLELFLSLIWPVAMILLILGYQVLVWGGWESFMHDLEYTVSTRTKTEGVTWLHFLSTELQRTVRNWGVSLSALAMCFLFGKTPKNMKVMLVLMLVGAWIFPFWVKRATLVHEYFSMWMILPLCWMGALGTKSLFSGKVKQFALLALLLLTIAQSFWVGRNRMMRYDSDYLLAKAVGELIREYAPHDIILTDIKDNEHIIQYYSESRLFLKVHSMADIDRALASYDRSGRTSNVVFVSITADRLTKALPKLKDYPVEKFTGEFGLEASVQSDFWQALQARFPEQKVGEFSLFVVHRASTL